MYIYIYLYLYIYIYTVPRLRLQSTFGGSRLPLFVDQVQLRNGLEHPAPPPHRPGSVNGASPEIPDTTWTQTCIYKPGGPGRAHRWFWEASRGQSCSAGCTKKQPRKPFLEPLDWIFKGCDVRPQPVWVKVQASRAFDREATPHS